MQVHPNDYWGQEADANYAIQYLPHPNTYRRSEFWHTLSLAYERLAELQEFNEYSDFGLFKWDGKKEDWVEIDLLGETTLLLKMSADIKELKKHIKSLQEEVRRGPDPRLTGDYVDPHDAGGWSRRPW